MRVLPSLDATWLRHDDGQTPITFRSLPSVDTVAKTGHDRPVGAEQQLREQMERTPRMFSAVVGGHGFPPDTHNLAAMLLNIREALVAIHDTVLRVGRQLDYLAERMDEFEKITVWIDAKLDPD